jgi:hypothetical protein
MGWRRICLVLSLPVRLTLSIGQRRAQPRGCLRAQPPDPRVPALRAVAAMRLRAIGIAFLVIAIAAIASRGRLGARPRTASPQEPQPNAVPTVPNGLDGSAICAWPARLPFQGSDQSRSLELRTRFHGEGMHRPVIWLAMVTNQSRGYPLVGIDGPTWSIGSSRRDTRAMQFRHSLARPASHTASQSLQHPAIIRVHRRTPFTAAAALSASQRSLTRKRSGSNPVSTTIITPGHMGFATASTPALLPCRRPC